MAWSCPLIPLETGEKVKQYTCCSALSASDGCVRGPHVFYEVDPVDLHKRHAFTHTRPPDASRPGRTLEVAAIDCEMIYTTGGMRVARVSMVDGDGKEIFDKCVKMDEGVHVMLVLFPIFHPRSHCFAGSQRLQHSVLGHHTRGVLYICSRTPRGHSGIVRRPYQLRNHPNRARSRERSQDTTNDSPSECRYCHNIPASGWTTIQTGIARFVRLCSPYDGPMFVDCIFCRVKEHLGRAIQTGGANVGHSSVEDSIATLDLVKWQVINKPPPPPMRTAKPPPPAATSTFETPTPTPTSSASTDTTTPASTQMSSTPTIQGEPKPPPTADDIPF